MPRSIARHVVVAAFAALLPLALAAGCGNTQSQAAPPPAVHPPESAWPVGVDAGAACFGAYCIGQPLPSAPAGLRCEPDASAGHAGSTSLRCAGTLYGHALRLEPFAGAHPPTFVVRDGRLEAVSLVLDHGDGGPEAAVEATRAALGDAIIDDDPDGGGAGARVGTERHFTLLRARSRVAAVVGVRLFRDHQVVTLAAPEAPFATPRARVLVHFDPEMMSVELLAHVARAVGASSREGLERDFDFDMLQTDIMMLSLPHERVTALRRVRGVRFVEPLHGYQRVTSSLVDALRMPEDGFAQALAAQPLRRAADGWLVLRLATAGRCGSAGATRVLAAAERAGARATPGFSSGDGETRHELQVAPTPQALAALLAALTAEDCMVWVEPRYRITTGR